MSTTTFAEFEAHARAAGAYEVLERRWAPGQVLAEHTHPFAVQALVVEGEFWLDCDGRTQHLQAGDRFALAAEQPHAERYGPEGAVFWAARHR